MEEAAAEYPPGAVQCVDLGSNQGKRAAMAAGIRRTTAEVLVFVDSDSVPAPRAIYHLVQPFAEPGVAAVSGLTYVRNAHRNLLTRMQAARYYVSFQLLKTAESMVCAVSCCSGCFAAYRRDEVVAVLEPWEHQTFLGAPCTHGDDRALTNMLLRRGHKARYQALAEAWTDAPEAYGKFFRQQLRWKKSWSREGLLLVTHIWRSRPLAFPAVLIQTFSGYFGPAVMIWNLAIAPGFSGVIPIFYFLALYMMATALRTALPRAAGRRHVAGDDRSDLLLRDVRAADLLGDPPHPRRRVGDAGRCRGRPGGAAGGHERTALRAGADRRGGSDVRSSLLNPDGRVTAAAAGRPPSPASSTRPIDAPGCRHATECLDHVRRTRPNHSKTMHAAPVARGERSQPQSQPTTRGDAFSWTHTGLLWRIRMTSPTHHDRFRRRGRLLDSCSHWLRSHALA